MAALPADPDPPPPAASPVDSRAPRQLGRWSLRAECDELSGISFDRTTLLESLRPALRDCDWNTIPPQVVEDRWESGANALHRTLRVRYQDGDLQAEGTSDLKVAEEHLNLRFTFRALTPLRTNRVGLTAMLPRSFAGEDARSLTPHGQWRDFRFPHLVSPWQPLFDIRALHLRRQGVAAELELTGDVFEMEDQRNWTDASYKIYSRPLALPFPYSLEAGDCVIQEVTLTAHPVEPPTAHTSRVRARVREGTFAVEDLLRDAPRNLLPGIGTGATTTSAAAVGRPGEPPTSTSAPTWTAGLEHLLVEVSTRFPHGPVLTAAAREAHATGLPVDLRITGPAGADLPAVLAAADSSGLPVVRVGVFDEDRHITTPALWQSLLSALGARDLETVAGARSHFTELNREIHAIPRDADAYAFPTTPQMHLRETWHIAESIGALSDVIASFRALRPDARLLLGPVTLRPRLNAVATRAETVDKYEADGYGAHHVPGATDPRQDTDWAAAWGGAMLLAAAQGGVETMTLGELAGPRGMLRANGTPTPTGELVADLAELRGTHARVANGFAGSGSAIAQIGDRLLIVNARLDEWSLHLGAGTGSALGRAEGAPPLRVRPGSHLVVPLSPGAEPASESDRPRPAAPGLS